MHILFAASEMTPLCKTGGLADVIGDLSPVLADMGHTVTVMLPGYAAVDRDRYGFTKTNAAVEIPVGHALKPLAISAAHWKGCALYLLENDEYFNRDGLYGDLSGDFSDNGCRFIFFSCGVLEAAKKIGLKPDIIHAHDWQTGLVPVYLATLYAGDSWFMDTMTLFTIHNLGYQGLFEPEVFLASYLPWEEFHWQKLEYYGKMSFLKGGIVHADAVSTVSETYADEITREPLGFGMQGVFAERRSRLFGIANGINQDEWNPTTDPSIPAPFSAGDLTGKKACRKALLEMCGLKAGVTTPVAGMVARFDTQKGFDLIEEAVDGIAAMDMRLIILGLGTLDYQEKMTFFASRYPDLMSVFIGFNNDMARLIYAGSDAFLMPSRYEPCGLGQLIAMRYGTLPVVHATGGLSDTVHDLDGDPEKGNGFTFGSYTPDALLAALERMVLHFKRRGRPAWRKVQSRAMNGDYSWKCSAEKYVRLYKMIGNFRKTGNVK